MAVSHDRMKSEIMNIVDRMRVCRVEGIVEEGDVLDATGEGIMCAAAIEGTSQPCNS